MESGQNAIKITRHPRARHLKLRVTANGTVAVSAPKRTPQKTIADFVHQHRPWIQKQQQKLSVARRALDLPEPTRQHYLTHKEAARELLLDRIALYSDGLGLHPRQVRIKNTTSRWGSCSSRGNVNLHYLLYFLPLELADYVVVHELCHLRHMNHSPAFWSLVESVLPEYKQSVARLRQLSIAIG